MESFGIFFLAIALSIDAMVVSFTQGLIFKSNKIKFSLLLAFFVGFFQFLMPVIGWLFANSLYSYFEKFSHIIIFIIFTGLGLKFIYDAIQDKEEEPTSKVNLSVLYLLTVAIATSIDALGAGFSIRFLNVSIIFSSILIGVITFINSLVGFWTGYLFKNLPSKFLEILGGAILVGLGLKTFLQG